MSRGVARIFGNENQTHVGMGIASQICLYKAVLAAPRCGTSIIVWLEW